MRSVAEYAASACTTWISTANLALLERTQLNTARKIMGQVSTTPTGAVIHEAHLPPLSSQYLTKKS